MWYGYGMKALATALVPFLLLFSFGVLAAESYYCPMRCEGKKTYEKPGKCPVCGMDLEKAVPPGSPGKSSLEYRVDVASDKLPKAGEPLTLTFAIRKPKDNAPVDALEVVHEKLFHLVIVSQDLSFFAHEHPVRVAPGDLKTTFTFPSGGNYILFTDFTPKGAENQIVAIPFQVDGKKRPEAPLKPDSGKTKKADGYDVSLALSPAPKAGREVTLKYRVRSKGKDVSDLEPYLGAGGHSIVVSEDTLHYLHSHPSEHAGHGDHGGAATKAYGPEVSFHTTFPKPGLYKAWAQFQRGGKVFTVDHVVKVD